MDWTAKQNKYPQQDSGEGDEEEDEEDSLESQQTNRNQREEATVDGGSDRQAEEAKMKRLMNYTGYVQSVVKIMPDVSFSRTMRERKEQKNNFNSLNPAFIDQNASTRTGATYSISLNEQQSPRAHLDSTLTTALKNQIEDSVFNNYGDGEDSYQNGGSPGEQPEESENKENQNAKKAFETLAQVLKMAKLQKERMAREQALKEAGLDPTKVNLDGSFEEVDIDSKMFLNINKKLQKSYIIYPDNKWKSHWDLIMTVLVIVTCIFTPYAMAFIQESSTEITVFEQLMNLFFLVDMILVFFSAYLDADYNTIDSHQTIAARYLRSWFLIDLVSLVPFDLIMMSSGGESGSSSPSSRINRIARLARLGKLQKLIKITRLMKILRIAKINNKFVRGMVEMLKINASFERLMFFAFIFFVLVHVVSCIWIFIGRYNPGSKQNWIFSRDFSDMADTDLYVTSFYFTTTTILTVGYGDICAVNMSEKILCIILMIIGVISFSFATGSLSSIIANYDQFEAVLQEKISTLNAIQNEYCIDPVLYNKCVKSLRYDHSKKSKDFINFLDELPQKIKLELAMEIHKRLYESIKFFQNKEKSFIAWVGTMVRPLNVAETEYIFKEGEEISEIYFLVKGTAAYVLPRFDNKIYRLIVSGEHFGHVDFAISEEMVKFDLSKTKRLRRKNMIRRFTLQALDNCEMLILTIDEMEKMRLEFPDMYDELFQGAYERLQKELILKMEIIKKQEVKQNPGDTLSNALGGGGQGGSGISVDELKQRFKEGLLQKIKAVKDEKQNNLDSTDQSKGGADPTARDGSTPSLKAKKQKSIKGSKNRALNHFAIDEEQSEEEEDYEEQDESTSRRNSFSLDKPKESLASRFQRGLREKLKKEISVVQSDILMPQVADDSEVNVLCDGSEGQILGAPSSSPKRSDMQIPNEQITQIIDVLNIVARKVERIEAKQLKDSKIHREIKRMSLRMARKTRI